MARYLLEFKKSGYIKYTSHLDMLRLFKRSFKRAGINLIYSQGFNPHPSMSFGQPLSLGYESTCELLEFDTQNESEPENIKNILQSKMPEGIEIIRCIKLREDAGNIASSCYEATYKIEIPLDHQINDLNMIISDFMKQEQITVLKYSKKYKEPKEINIRPMIRGLQAEIVDNMIIMTTKLDAGSKSNLSPDLLIKAFIDFAGISTDRAEMKITRIEMKY